MKRLPAPNLFAVPSVIAVAGLFAATGGAIQARADPQGLSSYVPVQVEDAIPVRLGYIELQTDDRFTQDSRNKDGSGLFNLEPVIKLGAAPGLQLDVSAPAGLGDQSGANQGSASFDALYQLNKDGGYLPSLAVHAYYATPFGAGHKSAEYTVRGIATKALGSGPAAPRLDVQVSWYHYTQPGDSSRPDVLEVGAAVSTLISHDTALVADFVHGEKTDKNKDQNIIDIGLRHELDDTLAVSIGAGIGVDAQSPEFRVLIALQKDLRLF